MTLKVEKEFFTNYVNFKNLLDDRPEENNFFKLTGR